MPRGMSKNREDNQIFNGDFLWVTLVRDGEGSTLRHTLILRMHPASAREAFGTVPVAMPIIRMVAAIRPLSYLLSVIAEVGEGLVIGGLDGEAAASWKLEEFSCRWWVSIAAPIVLEPEVGLGELV